MNNINSQNGLGQTNSIYDYSKMKVFVHQNEIEMMEKIRQSNPEIWNGKEMMLLMEARKLLQQKADKDQNESIVSSNEINYSDKSRYDSKSDFSLLTKILLITSMAFSFFSMTGKFITNMLDGNYSIGCCMFICEIINMISFFLILKKKKIGVWVFFTMMILQIPFNMMIQNPEIGIVIGSALFRILYVSLILLIPSHSVSGWKVLTPTSDSCGNAWSEFWNNGGYLPDSLGKNYSKKDKTIAIVLVSIAVINCLSCVIYLYNY